MEDELNKAGIEIGASVEIPKTCPVCERLKEMCEEAGEGKFCNEIMEKLKSNEITGEQFVDSLMKNEKVAAALKLA